MKQQAIQYLAFDVHQATCVASLREESGSVVMRSTIKTEAKAIVQFVKACGPRVQFAFEEGTQAQWLHDLLLPHAERVVVFTRCGANPVANKNDELGANQLSEELRKWQMRQSFGLLSNVRCPSCSTPRRLDRADFPKMSQN